MSNWKSMAGTWPRQTVIEPTKGWQFVPWRELIKYRDLFYFLVTRDIKVLYKQTVLGFVWAIIRPVFSMVVFSVVFGGLAGIASDGVPYPIFSFAAVLPWSYFSTALTKSSSSLVGNSAMFTKVYFPRMLLPLTPLVAGLVDFGIASIVLGLMMLWYGIVPGTGLLVLPLLLALMMLTAAGAGMWLSALALQYRDVNHAMPFLTQLLLYAAPVVWPVSLITETYPHWGALTRLLYGIYPMAGVIEGFRAALLGTTEMPWDLIAVGSLSAILVAASGVLYFTRMQRFFADVA